MTHREYEYHKSKKKPIDPKIKWRKMIREGSEPLIKGLEMEFPGITYLSEALYDTDETIAFNGDYPPGYEDWLKETNNL